VQGVSAKNKPLVERAGGAVFWNVAFFPLKVLIPLLAGIVVVRQLRAEGFALYNVTLALLNTLGLFSDFGIERTLPRFYPEIEMRFGRRGIVRFLMWITLIKGIALLALVAALAIGADYWIRQFDLGQDGGWLLAMVAVLLVLGAASDVSIQLLYTHFKQKVTNALDILVAVARPSLTALFILVGWGALGAILALLLTTIVAVVLSLWQAWLLLKIIPEEPHRKAAGVKRPSERSLRDRIVSFAGLNYLVNWSVYLYDRDFVVLFMSFLLAPDELKFPVATISLAYKFTKEFLRALVVPLTGVQTPLFARLYAEGRIDGLRTAYATITKFLMLALLPAGVGLIVAGGNLLQVLYGQVGPDAVLSPLTRSATVACTVILAIGLFGEAMISVALNVLVVYEDYRAVVGARLFSLVSIPLLVWLVPQYGAVGAAIAVSVAGLGSRFVALVYALRRLQLPFPTRFFTRVGTASLVMGFALLPILAFLPPNWPSTILMVGAGVVVFLLAFKGLGGIEPEDKERFRSLRLPFMNLALRFL
jgi:O-antigen/teichoic acid export membrane protein